MEEIVQLSERLKSKRDERYYRICKVGFLFAFLQHCILFLVFTFLDVSVLSGYNILSIVIFVISFVLNEKRRFYIALTIAYAEILIHQTLVTFLIGWNTGFHAFILFNIMFPLFTQRGHVVWKTVISGSSFVIYLILLLIYRTSDPVFDIPITAVNAFAIVNALSFVLILVLIAGAFNSTVNEFEEELEEENRYANSLLLNILPKSIAERIGKEDGAIANGVSSASVLFADIVGFTEFAESVSPERLVKLLDHLFTRFDLLCDRFQCEKIKTIGDAYMVAAGVPDFQEEHAITIVKYAIAMQEEMEEFNRDEGVALSIRIGIHSGSVVAGVIGKKKFSYDLWGDTVNTASRMESSGVVGKIQISEATNDLINSSFITESRGKISVKGKGKIETYLVKRSQ